MANNTSSGSGFEAISESASAIVDKAESIANEIKEKGVSSSSNEENNTGGRYKWVNPEILNISSEEDVDAYIQKLRDLETVFERTSFDTLSSQSSFSEISWEPDIKQQYDLVVKQIEKLKNDISSVLNEVLNVVNAVKEDIAESDAEIAKLDKNIDGGAAAGAAPVAGAASGSSTSGGSTSGGSTDGSSTSGGSTSGGSTDGRSTSGGSTSGGSTDGSSKSEKSTEESSKSELKRVSTPEASKSVGLVSALDISAEVLAMYGVTKGNIASVTKSENGYTISVKNQNADGKWKATDIKEYYIKDGSVSGALTGNGTYIKIEDGKIQIDQSSSNVYNDVFSTASGASETSSAGATTTPDASVNYATQTSYNTDANKAIFNKFYPDATEGEFNNFCSQISESEGAYSDAAKSLINTYKGDIADISAKNGYNYLVIENNTIKVDYKSVATELYAYESSKTGISYTGGMGTQLSFNESTAADLSEYVKQNYSVDVDFKSLVGNINEAAVSNETSAV